MAKEDLIRSRGTGIQALPYDETTQKLAFSGTAVASSAVGSGVTIVRLVATGDCHYKFGSDPTVTTADCFLPSGVVEYRKITGGHKVSVIGEGDGASPESHGSGTLYVSEINVGYDG